VLRCLSVQADGTVVIPEVLRPYMMGIQAIKPKHTVKAP
jgi:seryl-tRNA synthetase